MPEPRTKLFYKIGEVSRLADVEPYILRYWETEFPSLAPRKNQGGQRVYQPRDLEMVLSIKRMLHEEGYTIAGARKKLAERPQPKKEAGAGPLNTGAGPSDTAGGQSRKTDARDAAAEMAARVPPGTQLEIPLAAASPEDKNKAELAHALGKFKEELRGILELIK